jgi:hypothetical protein
VRRSSRDKRRRADEAIAQGKVKTQASPRLRKVNTCTPESLAAIAERKHMDRVETGRPKLSATAIHLVDAG